MITEDGTEICDKCHHDIAFDYEVLNERWCRQCLHEFAEGYFDTVPTLTVTVPREEWERMKAKAGRYEAIAHEVSMADDDDAPDLLRTLRNLLATPSNAEETQTTQ